MNEPKRRVAVFANVRETPNGPTKRELKNTGYFHGWFQVGNGIDDSGPVAIVEYDGGKIDVVEPRMVEFLNPVPEKIKPGVERVVKVPPWPSPEDMLRKIRERLYIGQAYGGSEAVKAWCSLAIEDLGL